MLPSASPTDTGMAMRSWEWGDDDVNLGLGFLACGIKAAKILQHNPSVQCWEHGAIGMDSACFRSRRALSAIRLLATESSSLHFAKFCEIRDAELNPVGREAV